MARMARAVVPGLPHHVTQRGNFRAPIFFSDEDYALYRRILARECKAAEVSVWAYCLMPNHVHLILTPATEVGLGRAVGETNRQYARHINARAERTGHLFQGRFSSVVMSEGHLRAAGRYVSLNPLRAQLVERAEAWRWASTRAHLIGKSDGLVDVEPLLNRIGDFAAYLQEDAASDANIFDELRKAERTGRPVGDKSFVEALELRLGTLLTRRKPGRKKRACDDEMR